MPANQAPRCVRYAAFAGKPRSYRSLVALCGGLVQFETYAQPARHAWPAFPRSAGIRAAEFLAVGFHRLQRKAFIVEHVIHRVVHHIAARRGGQVQHTDLVAVLHQIVHNVFADGTRAACNQNFFHGAMVAAPTVPGVKRA